MDQITSDLGDGAPLDHCMTGFYSGRLLVALQCDPRSPNIGRNQGHHLDLPLDDEFSTLTGVVEVRSDQKVVR